MLSPFGKWVRAFREEKRITLRQMAKTIGKTPSYLSAIELGRKAVPDSMFDKLSNSYDLDNEMKDDLYISIRDSKLGVNLKFDQSTSAKDRQLAMMFASNFDKLPSDKKAEFLAWMEKFDE